MIIDDLEPTTMESMMDDDSADEDLKNKYL